MSKSFLQRLSIKRKLVAMMMLTTVLALVLCAAGLITYEWFAIRDSIIRDLTSQAEIVAANSKAALSFGDSKEAVKTLGTLEPKPHIVAAAMFSVDGTLLGQYVRPGRDEKFIEPHLRTRHHYIEDNYIIFYQPVIHTGDYIGLVYLKSDMQPFYARFREFAAVVSGVLVVAILGAFALASRLQGIISKPVQQLSQVTRTVSVDKNYGVRAVRYTDDELGTLIDGFNEMLDQIQSRDGALQRARDELEVRVADRTRELQQEVGVRKRAEDALAGEKELLSVTLRSIGDAVIATDRKGQIVLLNAVAEKLTGWSAEEAVGAPIDQVFKLNGHEPGSDERNPVLAALESETVLELAKNARLVPSSGNPRMIAGSASPLRDNTGRLIGLAVAFRDITEQQRMADELLKASKLESLGILAGGIAHDFNNILGAVLGNLSLAKMFVPPTSEVGSTIDRAVNASLRARELTRQLLTFAKGGSPVKKTASIGDLISETARFVLRGSNVSCEYSISPDLWPVDIDEVQISQVIDNLVINAMQAMPNGGRLDIRAENVTLNADSVVPLKPGRYIQIVFRDSGIGIEPVNLPKIFDPYFTTKNKGSGLGLATTYSIIKKHDGHICVDSCVGAGTEFQMFLPASSRQVVPTEVVRPKPVRGSGRVLVMDDEPSIRQLLQTMLRVLGYEVETVRDGGECLDAYGAAQSAGKPFKAVIMDLTIPGGMGGQEAIRHLLAIDPDAKAIVSSGYSNDPVMAQYREYGFAGVVAKPYQVEELSRVLFEVVSPAARAA